MARPRPYAAVTEARQGDLTVQHGGGGRLGSRVEAATAAPAPRRKHLLLPPSPSSLLGQGWSQISNVPDRPPGSSFSHSMASSTTVPLGFHYETKFVVLSYLGLLSQEKQQGPSPQAFTSTGFDYHTSPVFSPADPESSIEDCLAHLGERVSQDLKEPLQEALQTILSQPVTYEAYRECTVETAVHASGWNKLLVPLVLLQQMLLELTRRGQEPLSVLLQFGVTYLEDHAAEFIIQQGGWGTVFSLESEEEEYPGIIAEDSNDIYILPSDNSGQVSPPESPTVTTSWQSESLPVSLSASQSWHTESLPVSLGPESWQQIAMDPEEVKSLDSSGPGEKSENNSSNSDIVHVEKEEVPEEAFPGAAVPLLPHVPTMEASEMMRVEKTSPTPSVFVELGEEELEAVTVRPDAVERVEGAPQLSEEGAGSRKKSHTGEAAAVRGARSGLPAEGKAVLLFGGAAAVAILAVAVGVALALRKK
ncbi:bcl-2-like protein 13 isoform X3 [Apodemus sylvaticus]|uniref:bcl-2-like protein 13 isoform X3 n=1 Tax=Apodemus sylvaticus TaxID=10129 RepID=UPI002243E7CF|nr:bcl-2-like protein 13 isoform X3 [Apodemus sylvaticus]